MTNLKTLMGPQQPFHAAYRYSENKIKLTDDGRPIWIDPVTRRVQQVHFRFELHQHPYTTELMRALLRESVPGLQAQDTATPPLLAEFFQPGYDPAKSSDDPAADPANGVFVEKPYPRYELDFQYGGAYAIYNWELFFHVPLTIAIHLSRSQKFEEARRWFHYIFDPTDKSTEAAPARFWKFAPFKTTEVEQMVTLFTNLASGADPALKQQMIDGLNAWSREPFRPHLVAKTRPSAYMYKTFMAYLDNHLRWADTLFLQDSTESIDEALGLYVEVRQLLGDRPQKIPRAGEVKPQTYASLRQDLDQFSNALRKLETELPFDVLPLPAGGAASADASRSAATDSLGRVLYFCIPHNDRLLGYWDTVADRLFKIRSSLNFRGIFRQLPLFDPPIDPGKLAAAAAAGVDIAAIVSGANQPLPTVRFSFLIQKAMAVCQEAKSLGNQLLGAIEKDDAEQLALIRSRHETEMLSLSEAVKYGQFQEATKSLEALDRSLNGALQRYSYYERMLGRKPDDIKLPEYQALDKDGLLEKKLRASEPAMPLRAVDIDIVEGVGNIAAGHLISRHEALELGLSLESQGMHVAASALNLLGGILGLIPQFNATGTPMGVGAAVGFGGVQLSRMSEFMASALRIAGDIAQGGASLASRLGGFARREQEWAFQSNNIAAEIGQIFKQYRAAEIRQAVAELEWHNHQKQIKNAQEIDKYLTDERNGKQANKALYAWMKREIQNLYSQSFSFALEVARKAERALQFELADESLGYLGNGYTGGRFELLAGDRLMLDLQRMDIGFQELQPAILKPLVSLSLSELDPLALLQLRATGRCSFSIDELILDRKGPGEYLRRIESVSVSIPCIVGGYANVHCKLTLRHSTIRKSTAIGDGYSRVDTEDARFEDYFGSAESVVLSTANNDTGWSNDADSGPRYTPFEGKGVIGEWELQLPADPSKGEPCEFDYDTIRDVELSIRYRARDGGEILQREAKKALTAALADAGASGAVRLFSIRHDFPEAWDRLTSYAPLTAASPAPLQLELTDRHYPYWSQRCHGGLVKAMLLTLKPDAMPSVVAADGQGPQDDAAFTSDAVRAVTLTNRPLAGSIGTTTLYLTANTMKNLWLLVYFKKA